MGLCLIEATLDMMNKEEDDDERQHVSEGGKDIKTYNIIALWLS